MGELGREDPIGASGAPEPPATATLLCVGGRRHGDQVTVPVGSTSWVDLLSAETYYPRAFKYVRRDPANPMSTSLKTGHVAEALVHESIFQDSAVAQQWWMGLALERLFLEVGREVPVSEIIGQQPGATPPNGRASRPSEN